MQGLIRTRIPARDAHFVMMLLRDASVESCHNFTSTKLDAGWVATIRVWCVGDPEWRAPLLSPIRADASIDTKVVSITVTVAEQHTAVRELHQVPGDLRGE